MMLWGKRHQVLLKDKDIALLMQGFIDDDIHTKTVGRGKKLLSEDKSKDVVGEGVRKLMKPDGLSEWWRKRAGLFGWWMGYAWPWGQGSLMASETQQAAGDEFDDPHDYSFLCKLFDEFERQEAEYQVADGM
jgi:hypothetical protein